LKKNDHSPAKDMTLALKKESQKCSSLDDYVNFVYNFGFRDYSITPLQIKKEISMLLEILSKSRPKTLLEIGTASGGTLFLLCKIADPTATIISVDLPGGSFGGELYPDWKESVYESFATDRQKIHLLRSDSHNETTFSKIKDILGNKKLDFLLIDADHTFYGVKGDFEIYSKLVADDGIIAFHDITPGPKENGGDVPEFWQKIKSQYPYVEIVDNESGIGYGIGLLVMSNNSSRYDQILQTLVELKDRRLEELQKNSLKGNNPIGILLSLYDERHDLQQAFPEVSSGDLTKFMHWAAEICNGESKEETITRQRLLKFAPWYNQYKRIHVSEEKQAQIQKNLENELAQHKNELAQYKNEIALYRNEAIQNKNEIIQYRAEITQHKNELAQHKNDLAQIKTKNESLEHNRNNLLNENVHFKNNITSLEKDRKNFENTITQYRIELNMIKSGVGFRITRFCGSIIDRLIGNTPVREAKRTLSASTTILKTEGAGSLLHHAKEKIKRNEFTVLSPPLEKITNKTQDKNKQQLKLLFSTAASQEEIYELKFSASVVIPTNSDATSLMFIIDKINMQKGIKDLEIILVNSGQDDLAALGKYSNLQILNIDPREFNHGKSRNLGASKATGDFLILLTDDAIPVTDHLFYDMCKKISEDPKIAVATGRQIPRSDSDITSQFNVNRHYFFLGLNKDRIRYTKNFDKLKPAEKRQIAQIDDVCSCYKSEIFSKYKFNEIQYAEDLDLGIRLIRDGYKIAQLYPSGVIHSHTRSASYHVKRGFVDTIWLNKLLEQDGVNFKQVGVQSIQEILIDAFTVYQSLGASIDIIKETKTADLYATFNILNENLPKLYASGIKSNSLDKSIDNLFLALSVFTFRKEKGPSFLLDGYLDALTRFKQYMTETYPNIINIEEEFFETLYKIFGSWMGNAVGEFVTFANKNHLENDDNLRNVEEILARGI
jgi:predicted O-methyltransferase YrrM/GT2 family glycosyltransferase